MTRDEFAEGYATMSKVPLLVLLESLLFVPCDCGELMCPGWQAVHRDNVSVLLSLGHLKEEDVEPAKAWAREILQRASQSDIPSPTPSKPL